MHAVNIESNTLKLYNVTKNFSSRRDDSEPLKFFEALSKCQLFNDEDISTINMAKVGDIHHFDPPTRYFTHKIWINAVKWQGTWYQFNQVPSLSSETFDDYIANGIVSVIPMMIMEHLGLESSSGFDNAGVIFNPFKKALEIFNIDEKRSYICTHQKVHKYLDFNDFNLRVLISRLLSYKNDFRPCQRIGKSGKNGKR